mgnify:CR=1 FL=1
MDDPSRQRPGPPGTGRPCGGGNLRRALIAALLVILVVPAFATASRGTLRADDRVPSAQVQATGGGAMTVTGRMAVNGSLDRGSVTVTDRAGDARAHLAGVPLTFQRGRAQARRASGILFVTGSDVTVQVTSPRMSFSIAGNGRARFLGSGTYRLNSDPEKSWSRAWIKVAPPTSPERRRVR